jgi:hypothetical protein
MAAQADQALAVAQVEFGRNLHFSYLAACMHPERMGPSPFLGQVTFQAEFDGGCGEPAGIQLRIGINMASRALRRLLEITVRVRGELGRRMRRTWMEKEKKRRQEETRREGRPGRNDPQRGSTPG